MGFDPGIPDGLIRDARVLLDFEESQLEAIREDLNKFPGFLEGTELESRLRSHVRDEESCRRLARLIGVADDRWRQLDHDVSHIIGQVEKWLADVTNQKKGLLSQEEFQTLRKRLPIIIQRYPALDRQAKAESLAEATGQPLQKLELICDLRPVFDKARDKVEGMIPLTILKVVCTAVDGLPIAMEAILSEKDVARLAKATADAQRKLQKLRALVTNTGIPIPSTDLTRQSDE